MKEFFVVGVNYKKTDASVRGLFAVNTERYEHLMSIAPQYGLNDFFILSTCNRTEIYGFAESADQLINFICNGCTGNIATFTSVCYSKGKYDAIAHLYHVAAGLDSQILGDFEILGQIKAAVKLSKANGLIGAYTERLINSVLQASKSIKTNTELSGGTVSVSFAAVQFIKQNIADFQNKKIVLIGTGKIGRVTCRNLVDYLDTHNITLINRTEETAVELARELSLQSAPIEHLSDELGAANIILVSTNSAEPIILKQHIEGKGAKLIVDMSVPSNVEVAAQSLPGVTFADVDMLSKIKDETLAKRQAEVPKALAIIEEHIAEFKEWCDMRKHVPVLKEVKHKLQGIHIDPLLLRYALPAVCDDNKIQKVINSLATKMRSNYTPGCHYIQAINDFIA